MFREQGKNAFVMTSSIDQPFISSLEMGDDPIKFMRIDAEVTEDFKEEVDEEEIKKDGESLSKLFKKALDNDKLEVKVEKLKDEKIASMITMSEETRRMQDMMRMYSVGGMGEMPDMGGETLVLNLNNELVKYLLDNKKSENADLFCKQLYDLALISNRPLAPDKMSEFILRSNEIMSMLAKK